MSLVHISVVSFPLKYVNDTKFSSSCLILAYSDLLGSFIFYRRKNFSFFLHGVISVNVFYFESVEKEQEK